jgi:hypothetical protein
MRDHYYAIYDEERRHYLTRSNSDSYFYKTRKGAEKRAELRESWTVHKFQVGRIELEAIQE